MRRLATLLFVAVMAASCGMGEWHKPPGVSESAYKKDRFECLERAQVLAPWQQSPYQHDQIRDACMEARGYRKN